MENIFSQAYKLYIGSKMNIFSEKNTVILCVVYQINFIKMFHLAIVLFIIYEKLLESRKNDEYYAINYYSNFNAKSSI